MIIVAIIIIVTIFPIFLGSNKNSFSCDPVVKVVRGGVGGDLTLSVNWTPKCITGYMQISIQETKKSK